MISQECSNILNYHILGPYYVFEDRITAYRNRRLVLDQHGDEVAVITGGHRGIGAMVTKDLLSTGMHVILGCRKVEEGERFVNSLREQGVTTGKTTIFPLDLASLESVRTFASAVQNTTNSLDYIINNAGLILSEFVETVDKMESVWQVNYLSHFLLCHLLLPLLQTDRGTAKIVNVSSLLHKSVLDMDLENLHKKENFNKMTTYSRSKLAQIMFTLYLNDKLRSINSSIEVVAVHPGIVNTEALDGSFLKKYFPFIPYLFFKTPEQGAKPVVYAALHGRGGEYICNCAPRGTSALSRDVMKQQRLFDESKKSLGITKFGNMF